MRKLVPILAVAALALLAPTAGRAADPTLVGTVGPGFSISLQDESGNPVTRIQPGTYTILVHDRSEIHNFHLTGPGVNLTTEVEQTGDVTWSATFQDGVYGFFCDPHSDTMRGALEVGSGAPAPVETKPVETKPAPAAPGKLSAAVGPGFTISLRRGARAVTSLRPGAYTIVVRDLSASHDFHLTGPGLDRRTSVPFRGTATWKVTLRKGVYHFVCDPHASAMKGSFRVVGAVAAPAAAGSGANPYG